MSATPKPERVEPVPAGNAARLAGHHWLLVRDGDGHTFGEVVLQWAPSARRWCRSNDLATGRYVDATYYKYLAPCELPPLDVY